MMYLEYKESAWAEGEVCGGAKSDTESRAAEIGILPNPKRIAQLDMREKEKDQKNRERGRIKEGTGERRWRKDRGRNREKWEDNKQEGEENKG